MKAQYIEGCIVRKARRNHKCWGNGARKSVHAEGCPLTILKGDNYVEYVGESRPYESGSRHSIHCADVYLTEQEGR